MNSVSSSATGDGLGQTHAGASDSVLLKNGLQDAYAARRQAITDADPMPVTETPGQEFWPIFRKPAP